MSHRRVKKRNAAIAVAGAAVVATAAIVLPNASASQDDPQKPRAFSQKEAARLGTTLASKLGAQSAGWFFDGESERLVMNVLDERSADQARAQGAEARIVENSMAELKSATRTLRETASVPGTAWSIDPRTNKVSVIADRTVTGSRLSTLSSAVESMGGLVTVKRSAGEFQPFTGGLVGGGEDGEADGGGSAAGGGDAGGANTGGAAAGGADTGGAGAGGADAGGANTGGAAAGGAGEGEGEATEADGGDAIFGGGSRCSLGFNVVLNGAPAFLTAGHCGNVSEAWTADQGAQQPLGTVVDSQFPESDFAIVRYDDPNTAVASSVDLQNGTTQEIAGAAEASVGMEVVRSGSTTGVSDGTVTGLDATVNYGNGDIVNGLIQTDVCAEPGDSGGSLFSGNQAIGLTSGGSGDCTVGGETFFQPVTAALEATGAQLGAGDGGDAEAGGAQGDVNAPQSRSRRD